MLKYFSSTEKAMYRLFLKKKKKKKDCLTLCLRNSKKQHKYYSLLVNV